MKIVSLALASGLAIAAAGVQPAAAQTQDQTGVATVERSAPDDAGSATTGSGHAEDRSDDRGYDEGHRMVMPMRAAQPHRRMMMRGAAAHFHFARGNARMDVTCSVQEDTEACVRAAGELIDKIAELHRGGGDRDSMNGSAGQGDERSGAQSEDQDESGAPGERM